VKELNPERNRIETVSALELVDEVVRKRRERSSATPQTQGRK